MTLCSVVHCEMLCASLAVGWTCKCNSFSFSPIFLQHSAMLVVLQLEQKTESESSIVAQNSNKCHGWKWLILHFSLTLSSLKRTPLSLSRHNCWLRFQKLWQRNPDIITLTLMTLVVMYWSAGPFQILSSVAIILTLGVDLKPKCFATNLGSNGNFAKIHKSSLYTKHLTLNT